MLAIGCAIARFTLSGSGHRFEELVLPACLSRTCPMPAVFEFPLRVTSADLDGVIRHVNNLVYLKWMQSAAVAHSAVQGWPAERYQELGAGWVVRSHHIEYLQAAFDDDEIIVRTWVAN